MMNLNDTPSAGPLTADDLARYRALHRAHVPLGCDQQGRYPQAAEAGTELGADDDLACASGIVRAVMWTLAAYLLAALTWAALS